MGILELLIVLILLSVVFSGPWWPYSRNWGPGPVGLLVVILVVLIVLRLI